MVLTPVLVACLLTVCMAGCIVLREDADDDEDGGAGGPPSQAAPSVAFNTDETRDRVTLVAAEADLDWAEFKLKTSVTARHAMNRDAAVDDAWTTTTTYTSFEPARMLAGDFLDLCAPDGDARANTIQILHAGTAAVVYEGLLMSVAAC